jgi:REP element-mobilizing transposase RayT
VVPMSRTRYRIFETEYPYFLTCTVVGWLPVFTRPSAAEVILDSLRYLQTRERLSLFAYVILENHLHLIAQSPTLANTIARVKSFTARRVIDLLQERAEETLLRQLRTERAPHKADREFQFWQEGSHPKQIVGDEMMGQKVEYIHRNPVKRGYVDDPTHWWYSSARNYAGVPGLIDVVTDWNAPGRAAGCTAER